MSRAAVTLVVHWPMSAATTARTAVIVASELAGRIAAAESRAKTMSAAKLAAKETSPASVGSHQPRLRAGKKNALSMIPAPVSAGTIGPERFACC